MNRFHSPLGFLKALAGTAPLVIFACTHHAQPQPLAQSQETSPRQVSKIERRPSLLVQAMVDSPLKARLNSCKKQPPSRTKFSIAHRGAPLHYPEHTRESYIAAARMGAGRIECDVTFTKDRELVCRHSQCDLHSTTNILETSLANRCRKPFSAAAPKAPQKRAEAQCCVSDLTLREFKSLCGRMGETNPDASSVSEYLTPPPDDQRYPVSECPALLSHTDSIHLLDELGVDFIPELKKTLTPRDEELYPRLDFARRLLDEYEQAGVSPERVFPQSFFLSDIRFWMEEKPKFAKQAIFLDGRFDERSFNRNDPTTFSPTMFELKEMGIRFLGPPIWGLLRDEDGELVPSDYAIEAKRAGLSLIPWSLERPWVDQGERPGPKEGLRRLIEGDRNFYPLVDFLAQKLGITGVFSDWPESVTYYANCLGPDHIPLD